MGEVIKGVWQDGIRVIENVDLTVERNEWMSIISLNITILII